ncbi:hypothetical protein OJAV_G00170970 [Oryzias javanicus]|uniref:Glutamate-rich protein 2 n=1 Tax=Oryzias javanicus TaxID=123683 RepID=A0A3S2M7A1_ORYJA|nr:hypothetical protein OJAV_G00170970 [Oryzias javanicus]
MNEDVQISASVDEELVNHSLMEPQSADSATAANGKNERPDEEDEDCKAPLGLLMEFIRALKDKDFQLAFRLCQMTLIYEPTNPEAAEILPLLQQKLLEEEGTEESSEEEDDSERDERWRESKTHLRAVLDGILGVFPRALLIFKPAGLDCFLACLWVVTVTLTVSVGQTTCAPVNR